MADGHYFLDARAGEIAGLFASLAWAIGSLIFSRARAPAAALNLFKNSVAAALFLVSVLVVSSRGREALLQASPRSLGWLTASALVGIVIGDTAYFRSLQILGPRRALVLTTLAPTLAALLAWWILDERLSGSLWLGMGVTLLGVTWVILEGGGGAGVPGIYPGSTAAGFLYGCLGSLCQALGAVWSRLGMSDLEPLEASAVRLTVAAAAGLVLAIGLGKLRSWSRLLLAPGVPIPLAVASALGTYLGIWSSLMAFKYARVAVATTLTTLSPIFVIPLAWLFLRQRSSPRAILGAGLAVCGVVILF